MEVIDIRDRESAKRKKDLLEVLDVLRTRIESGEIEEFVASTVDTNGEVEISACVKDTLGGVGLFEIGKHMLIAQQHLDNYDSI
jgi:hypothetical protein